MNKSIFKTPRRGLMGSKPLGAEYMLEVNERARRMKAAAREQEKLSMATDNRQMWLPGLKGDLWANRKTKDKKRLSKQIFPFQHISPLLS